MTLNPERQVPKTEQAVTRARRAFNTGWAFAIGLLVGELIAKVVGL